MASNPFQEYKLVNVAGVQCIELHFLDKDMDSSIKKNPLSQKEELP